MNDIWDMSRRIISHYFLLARRKNTHINRLFDRMYEFKEEKTLFTPLELKNFSKVSETLKKYRRADLIDETGKNILEQLYVDLLPNDFILNKSLLDNTTFLIGRKGTGKSTIFLKLENEYRKKEGYLPCYIDVKTVYESSKSQSANCEHLKEFFADGELSKYLMERNFIQNVLKAIYSEIDKKELKFPKKIIAGITNNSNTAIKERVKKLISKVENNKYLGEIEIPILAEYRSTSKNGESFSDMFTSGVKLPDITISAESLEIKNNTGISSTDGYSLEHELTKQYTDIFLKVFEIKNVITEISEILSALSIRHLIVLLDDVSEIDTNAIQVFIDTIVAPLNNWSNEFIKFKVAFYPNRVHYGNIDPGKIDIIYLDFYNLYSEFDANKMTEYAIDFTKRLLSNRFTHFGLSIEKFFDTSKVSMSEYYELFFYVSMNVPRIMGYILSFIYQSKIVHGGKVNKSDIEKAAQKYFDEKINTYLDKGVYCLLSKNATVTIHELGLLNKQIVNQAKEIKTQIVSEELTGSLYDKKEPFSSHFYIFSELESYLESLELNHFISKFSEQSNRDGKKISVYCLNYGQAVKNNIFWGKKSGAAYRKYFIERPFNYSKIILDFFANKKEIVCSNPTCKRIFSEEELQTGLKFTKMSCPDCHHQVSILQNISKEMECLIAQYDNKNKLPELEYTILHELFLQNANSVYARDIAEETDYSSILIAYRYKKLEEDFGYIIRDTNSSPYKYAISDEGKEYFQ